MGLSGMVSLRKLLISSLIILLTLAGCRPVPEIAYGVTPEPSPEPTITPAPANFTATPTRLVPSLTPTSTSTPSAAPTAAPPPFCTPLEDHSLQDLQEIVTQAFNPPPVGKDTGHHGVDFAYFRRGDRLSIAGVHIQSVLSGSAAAVIVDRIPYGNMIIIETPFQDLPQRLVDALSIPAGQSLYVLYAHMANPPLPALGDALTCGDMIGEVGNTPKGWSSDPHLHLEARYGPPGVRFEDMDYYDNTAPPEAMANYERWRMSGEFVLIDPLLMVETGLGGKD